ncbi:MAG: hypothetical protein N0C89_12945 [Candidatus Thiodiazotropha endolucinida]|nr:hypothetical protein [Candidatus Thiodiazotropha taylori]MCW4331128.1 hypothetical protein [Candidatus Thiodiazotropha endolucinida]
MGDWEVRDWWRLLNMDNRLFDPDNYIALGTLILAVVGYFGVVTAIKAKQREILSGLKITKVQGDAVAWIKNTSKEWIKFKVWVDPKEQFKFKFEEKEKEKEKEKAKAKDYAKAWVNYSNGCDDFVCDKIKQAIEEEVWKPWHRDKPFKLAPGAKVPIHLKDITIEETYVALAAVKIEIDGDSLGFLGRLVKVEDDERTRVVLYRYAGDKISRRKELKRPRDYQVVKPNKDLAEKLHPHNQWVAVESD